MLIAVPVQAEFWTFVSSMLLIEPWRFLLAVLPPLIVLNHAVYLQRVRSLSRGLKAGSRQESPGANERMRRHAARARALNEKHFSPQMLFVRLGVPAILLFLVTLIVLQTLFPSALFSASYWPRNLTAVESGYLKAARYGATGAYVFALLNLGQRNFRHDITNGGVIWAAVTLALGPALAFILAHISLPSATESGLTSDSVFFLAGLSPKYVATAVEQGIRKIWPESKPSQSAPQVFQSLQAIRGMTAEIEERLAEEGVIDVTSLAMADPLQLLRNTSFSLKLLLSWIDEALLAYYAAASAEKLHGANFSGAIDLAWLADRYPLRSSTGLAYAGQSPGANPASLEIIELARISEMKVELVCSLIDRLYEDSQVQLVWAMFQLGEDVDWQGEAAAQRTDEAADESTPSAEAQGEIADPGPRNRAQTELMMRGAEQAELMKRDRPAAAAKAPASSPGAAAAPAAAAGTQDSPKRSSGSEA